ncbi:MAG: carboxypeptidase-like regulatory domain-containing protein [Planctomycetales bacterium]|nr:carboxypeptidase-like regulatory domain-containing protein [Planctomycetales bacterium]
MIGHVVDDDGKPVAGARVRAWDDRIAAYGERSPLLDAKTDAAGAFTVPASRGKPWWLKVQSEGSPESGTGFLSLTELAPEEMDPRILLSQGGRISARLLDGATRSPVPRGGFKLGRADNPKGYSYEIEDLEDGRIRLGPLPAGRYRLATFVVGYRQEPWREVAVEAGRETDLGTILLSRGGRLRGKLGGPAGEPVGWTLIRVEAQEGKKFGDWEGSEFVRGRTAEESSFEIAGAPDGCYVVEVTSARFVGTTIRDVSLVEGQIVERDIALGSPGFAALRVLDRDGNPLGTEIRIGQGPGRWEVTCLFEEASGRHGTRSLYTEQDGRVRTGPLLAGRWPVEASIRGRDGTETWVPLGEIDVALGENPEVTLRWPG